IIKDLALPHRMARILWILPDSSRAHKPGSLDSPETANVSLATRAERAQAIHGASPLRAREVGRIDCRRFADGLWRRSGHPAVQHALRNDFFDALGLPRILI